MKKIGILLILLFTVTLTPYAQQRGKTARKTAVASKQKTTKQKGKAGRSATKQKKGSTTSIQALEKERKQIQQQIKEQEQRLRTSQQDVKQRLQHLMVINSEIAGKRRTIDTIRHDIVGLDNEIVRLEHQLRHLQDELAACKERYVKSLRYMHRNRTTQSQLMFIFSADNLTQMYRRLRFMREYAAYQHVQGDEVKAQQEEVNKKLHESQDPQDASAGQGRAGA